MYVQQCGHKMADTPKWFILRSLKVTLRWCKDNAVEVHINKVSGCSEELFKQKKSYNPLLVL